MIPNVRPSQSSHPTHVLPVHGMLELLYGLSETDARTVFEIEGKGIEIQVDWNGDAGNEGHFKVMEAPGVWTALDRIDLSRYQDIAQPVS